MESTMDRYLQLLYEQARLERNIASERHAPDCNRERIRDSLRQALGQIPEQRCPLHAKRLERTIYDGFILERIVYTTMESVTVPVIVLIPKDGEGPWPAVLACHGHGNGYHDAVGLDREGKPLQEPGIHNQFAIRLVKQGMVVVIPEIMGFGARRIEEELKANPNYSSCSTLASHLLMYGRTLAGMRVYENFRALDYMAMRDDVNADRMGIFGFSGGGLIASYTAALDERVEATVLCGWANTFEGSILAMHHCIDNYMPGLLLGAEQPELIGLIAPRALFIETGEHDPIFPVSHTRIALVKVEQLYREMEASHQLDYDIFPGAHEISGRNSISWLYEKLRKN